MPWRGPEVPNEFPTLGFIVADWIEANCAVPDGEKAGEPFLLTDEQLRFLLWHYRLRPKAKKAGKPSSAFEFRRSQLVRPQKWGKGPLSAAMICAEAAGPVLFAGWDRDGEPIGKSWATPWIQVVAVSEDQTDNVWTALVPMIELGALNAEIPDTGKTRINVSGAYGSAGKIEPVTSAAISRLGQRITFAVHDETHSWTEHNGGVRLADVQRRNLAGMGGRSIETTNAWDPSEESVAQVTHESAPPDVYRDFVVAPEGSVRNKRDRRRVLKAVYGDSWWVDVDRIEAEILELLPRDPNQAERFYFNRLVAGADKAFDLELWNSLTLEEEIAPGRLVALGFDGSRRLDSTGLVATDVELGHQVVVGAWERPREMRLEDWEIPADEVTAAVDLAFETWDVWRLYGDPPYWETPMDEWAGRWGEERVVRWWTNRLKAVAYALKAFTGDIASGELSHDGNEVLSRHIGNAVKHQTRMRDDDGAWLWVIRKDNPKSPRKIDLAMAALLSWEARGDAIKDGALTKPTYTTAGF
jgi:hypothetical protein